MLKENVHVGKGNKVSIVEEQLNKLLCSVERFKEDLNAGNKRAAIGDMDFVEDRAISLKYLLLAQIEEENKGLACDNINESNRKFERKLLFNKRNNTK